MQMKTKFDGKDDEGSCVGRLLWLGVLVFILSAIVRVIYGGRNRLDLYICYGALILLVIALIVQFRNENRDAKISGAEKQARKESLINQEANIKSLPHAVIRSIPSFAEKRKGWGCSLAGGSIFVVGGLISQSPEYVMLGILFFSFPVLGLIISKVHKWLWIRRAVVSDAVIVERRHIEADDTAAYFTAPRYAITHDEEWILELGATPDQLARDPKIEYFQVTVNESQYAYYTSKTSVAIYYLKTKPFVFLLEDEV